MITSRVAIVVQARMSSRRLPGKVLMPLAAAPALVRMMERVARVRGAQLRVVATSEDPSDDPVARVCRDHDIAVVRGSLDDVLGRVLRAVPTSYGTVVRLTGDCPLVSPRLVDRHIEAFEREQPWAQYVSNAVVRTQPDGLDVEVVSREMLASAAQQANSAEDREHVLPWVRRHARTLPITQEIDLSALRWTLDTRSDYDAIAAIYAALYSGNPEFETEHVYKLLSQRPELIRVAGSEALDTQARTAWVERIGAHLASARGES